MTFGQFAFLLLVGFVFALIGYNVGYDKGIKKRKRFPWSATPLVMLVIAVAASVCASPAVAQMRTISWDPVVDYTDNTVIESANLPVRYDARYIDNVTGVSTSIIVNTTATSAPFDDAGMVKGRTYNFIAKARTQDGEESADSPPFAWVRPKQQPKPPKGTRSP